MISDPQLQSEIRFDEDPAIHRVVIANRPGQHRENEHQRDSRVQRRRHHP